ncbi:hypothetical protein HN592_05485 [Candidatus Woesearchaeota archaeon]|jgi:hypothetical protein|nr:hypothetical protein [Candidatus Woesearchaeota archaeon]MBT4367953.1 hypothetical protein [Candidatus Woesearchaeota archaeon]MBT4712441.1 hypothetical protein [Candidatus Woesearchaeota archaeon]MBT6639354.1 hypothetical protein [Candidatus Woesearchaeota archaeon]MBT7133526.1 hypothetical protein [Candidatus Woesearchaeota archaeon]
MNKGPAVADFWNSAELTSGCISCGKHYFYIDWDGNIMPCVFIPYYQDNLKDLYANGKSIMDAMFSDLFTKGRAWQKDNFTKKDGKVRNLMMPCLVRDNHKDFVSIVKSCEGVKGEDQAATDALNSDEYHADLEQFDEDLKKIEDPYWEEHYEMKDSEENSSEAEKSAEKGTMEEE